ncbi:hairy and enhancer of split-related 15, tandem duplicate 1 [Mastacembelus armatus]|uniref:Transcription factor HES-5 n=1 Tax=Mastacembelus armatus TaxID=205130 RepID=A0A7N8WHU0_9TELE|nr:transcription factor HES-5-like [Mastacembelus armatus]
MAPTTTSVSPISVLSTKDRHKLRKPVVEKMRRDRINTCIEQLKVLLEKEFHQQDPNGKLEKADVLEMTVVFLKQQLQPPAAQGHGYSHCWKRTLHFLSQNSLKEVTLPRLQYLQTASQEAGPLPPVPSSLSLSQTAGKQPAGPSRAVWRPW